MLQESQKEAESIALRAVEIARDHRHEMATLEHVLAALLETPEVQSCLGSLNVNAKELSDIMDHFLTGNFIEVTNRPGPPTKTASFETLFVRAIATAVFSPRKIVTPVDLLMHLSQFPHEDSYAVTALMRANVSTLMLKKYLAHGTPAASSNGRNHEAVGPEGMPVSEAEPNNREEAITFIRKYAANLNELAADGKIDPVIGRSTELDQTIQILARRTKNNVIFTGDPGVGKTAICEGLAYKIVNKEVPTLIKNATVWSLDVGSLVAGTRFRGDLEERLKLFLKALTFLSEPTPNTDPASPDIAILFIDEIHTIMEAGSGSKGSLDVSNMLKPALAKGTLRCIGSTTYEEYRKHFEKDRALARRFKKVAIDEPSPELTKAILRGLRKLYENYHHVTFTDEALDAAVDLTHRYVHTALLPDKAIDIIDQAGARQRIAPEDERLVMIDVPDIEIEVAKIVKFPPKEISEGEAEKLSRLEDDLKKNVFGQSKALQALNEAVMISRAGLREMNLTAGAYLFTGPTGVGKAQPLFSKILTPTGWISMSDVIVGTIISTPDGGSAPVVGVYPQGKKKIFRVTFEDGRQAECCDEHLWKVYNKHWSTKEKVIQLSEIRRLMTDTKGHYYVPLTEAVHCDEANLLVDPYLVGALIGDGNYSQRYIRFTTADSQILENVGATLPNGTSLKQYPSSKKYDWNVTGQQHLLPLIRSIGMDAEVTSHIKSLPKEYLFSSPYQRLQLLRGLLDTDGEVGKTGNIVYSTSSFGLAMDVMALVRSLGGWCRISSKHPSYTHNGEKRNGRESFRLAIRHPNPRQLFTLDRKLSRISENYQYSNLRLRINRIDEIGEYEAQCIMVDHPDHLYITDDYTVTHNTETARQLAKTLGIPLIKFDMSEYMERHSVSKLIGAPPGYVGFGDGAAGDGLLVNAVETNPSCVLLLDEVEKAHEDLFNVLLQVMDDAKLTNSQGKTVKFNNVILIMTTNAGVDATETSAIGFGRDKDDNEIDEKAIKRLFRPEFRNRLDAMIMFDRLQPENMIRIVDKFLASLSVLAGNKNVVIEASDEAREWLSVKGYDRVFGARPLTRVIDEHIKKPLSREMLFGELANGGTARITLENDSLHISGKKAN